MGQRKEPVELTLLAPHAVPSTPVIVTLKSVISWQHGTNIFRWMECVHMTTHEQGILKLKRTPLYEQHRELGARLVEFGGWEMPVQYSGILAEHEAVRTHAGLFDVSHMGEFKVEGQAHWRFCNRLSQTMSHVSLCIKLSIHNFVKTMAM